MIFDLIVEFPVFLMICISSKTYTLWLTLISDLHKSQTANELTAIFRKSYQIILTTCRILRKITATKNSYVAKYLMFILIWSVISAWIILT
jgi:hypothetical protein